MKKGILLIGFCMVLLSSFVSAQIIEWDGESNNVTDWKCEASSNMSINSSNPIVGNYSGWLTGTNGGDICSLKYSSPQTTNYTANFIVEPYFNNIQDAYILLSEDNTSQTNAIFIRCEGDADKWQYSDGIWKDIGLACTSGVQYNFSILHHSFGASSQADIRINGVSYKNNTLDTGAVPSPQYLSISTQASSIDFMLDNICFCPNNWNTTCCNTTGGGGGGVPTTTITSTSPIKEKQYNTIKIQLENFNINTSANKNAILNWNGSLYATTLENWTSNNTIWNVTFTTPKVYYNNTIYSFNFTYNITLNNGTIYTNKISATNTQTIRWNNTPFEINASNFFNGSVITSFTAITNGTTYNSNGSGDVRTRLRAGEGLYNVNILNAVGYENHNYTNWNVSNHLEAKLYPNTTTLMKIYAYSWNGNLLSNVNITVNELSETQYSNPFSKNALTLINVTNPERNITVIINDQSLGHVPLNTTFEITNLNYTFNLTLIPNKLALYFVNSTGNPTETDGTIYDLNSTRGWNASELIVVQQNLTEGIVKVHFGEVNGTNWTQYYEYINDFETYINETIELIVNPNKRMFFRVTTLSNSPVENAVVIAEAGVSELGTIHEFELIGRRLTDSNGYVSFFFDTDSQVKLTVAKDNYISEIDIFSPLDKDAQTKTDAIKYDLNYDTSSTFFGNTVIYIKRKIYTKDNNLNFIVNNQNDGIIKYATQYWLDNGGLSQTLTCNTIGLCEGTLQQGTFFTNTTNDNITFYVWNNNNLVFNDTIVYDPSPIEILTIPNLNKNYLNPLLFIAILIASVTVGFIFKTTNAGVATFFIGTLIASMISGWFIAVALTVVGYYLMRTIVGLIKE